MIRFQRSIRVARGRNLEAIQWAKQVVEYLNSKQPNYKVQAFLSRFGNLGTVVWQVDFEDLAALDKYEQFFDKDPGYAELLKKSFELFIEATVYDSVFDAL